MFDITLRGYDRSQVERRLRELVEKAEAEHTRAATERARAEAEAQRADAAEGELAAARQGGPPGGGREGFGSMMEEMLRVAEQKAAELRAKADQDAAKIVEQAQAHEREAAQSSAAVQAQATDQAERLRREMDTHREAIVSEMAAARTEADRLRSVAEADAATLLETARSEARDAQDVAEKAIAEQYERSHLELGRLRGARDRLCADLTRLQEVLDEVVTHIRHAADADANDPGDHHHSSQDYSSQDALRGEGAAHGGDPNGAESEPRIVAPRRAAEHTHGPLPGHHGAASATGEPATSPGNCRGGG